jgi:hypothetical protein
MKGKWMLVFIVVFLLLTGFIIYNFMNAKPPIPSVKSEGNKHVPVQQGSYCWERFMGGSCVDMVEPFMMNDIKIVPVKSEEEITISFKKKPLEKMKTVSLWKKGSDVPKVASMMSDDIFLAPLEEGVYAISTYNLWDRGSASHVFFIEVR